MILPCNGASVTRMKEEEVGEASTTCSVGSESPPQAAAERGMTTQAVGSPRGGRRGSEPWTRLDWVSWWWKQTTRMPTTSTIAASPRALCPRMLSLNSSMPTALGANCPLGRPNQPHGASIPPAPPCPIVHRRHFSATSGSTPEVTRPIRKWRHATVTTTFRSTPKLRRRWRRLRATWPVSRSSRGQLGRTDHWLAAVAHRVRTLLRLFKNLVRSRVLQVQTNRIEPTSLPARR